MAELKKQLDLADVFSVATGAMISSGLFILPAIAYSEAGPAVILSYLFASILIVPSVLSKAELARKAGVSPITIDRIEKGMACRMETKRKILLALGYKLSEKDKVFTS